MSIAAGKGRRAAPRIVYQATSVAEADPDKLQKALEKGKAGNETPRGGGPGYALPIAMELQTLAVTSSPGHRSRRLPVWFVLVSPDKPFRRSPRLSATYIKSPEDKFILVEKKPQSNFAVHAGGTSGD